MVDFEKLLGTDKLLKAIDPIEIFDYLDVETGKEEIRPSQKAVLKKWHEKFRDQKDIIYDFRRF